MASGLIEEASGVKGNALMVCSHPAIRPGSVCFWRVCFGKERHADLEREFIEDHWLVDERVPRVRRLGFAAVRQVLADALNKSLVQVAGRHTHLRGPTGPYGADRGSQRPRYAGVTGRQRTA